MRLIHIHLRVIGCVVVMMNMGDLLCVHHVAFTLHNSAVAPRTLYWLLEQRLNLR